MSTELAQDDAPPGALTATAQAAALVTQDDPLTQALGEVSTQTATILQLAAHGRALHERYKNVAFDVRTTKGMDEAKAARHALREEARYPIQRLKDARSKILGTMQRQANASADTLIAEIEGYETPIHEQIQAEEQRKESERREREAADARRRQGHIDAIAAISAHVAQAVGEDSAQIASRIEGLRKTIIDASWEEFEGQAQQALDSALLQLDGLLITARAEEQEAQEAREAQARLRAQQEQQAARARELEEREAALARQQAELEEGRRHLAEQQAAQQRAIEERRAAVQRRIEELSTYGAAYSHMAPSGNIESAIRTLKDTLIYPADYDDRVREAQEAKDAALARLQGIYDHAVEREAQEARQQLAALVQARIDTLEAAELTAGSPDRGEVQAALDELQRIGTPIFEDYGDRTSEATAIYDKAIAQLQQALVVIGQREAQEALVAAEREREQRRRAIEDMRQQLMRDNAILLFPAAHALVDFLEGTAACDLEAEVGTLHRLTDDVRGILRRIPKETTNA